MANGDGENKALWDKVNRIAERGCGHRETQDRDMLEMFRDLKQSKIDIWSAIDRERTAREGMIKQIVIGVMIIVCGGVILNMVALSYLLPKVMAVVK